MQEINILTIALLFASVIAGAIIVETFNINKSKNIQLLLTFSGAYLLAVSVLHLIPELFTHNTTNNIGLFILGGFLVIDFMNVKKAITNLVPKEQKTIDNIVFNITRKVENGHIIKDIEIIDGTERQHFQEKVKAITLADYSEFISGAGLKIIDIFGNYKLEDFNATSSDRLILICKK